MEMVKDDIIEELWEIKDSFSSACNQDIGSLIKEMNKIAEEAGFSEDQVNQQNRAKVA